MESHNDYLLELLKDRYEQESLRYKEFEGALGIPISILTALLAGVYIVGTDADLWKSVGLPYILFTILLTILGGCIITTICLLACVYWGRKRAWHTLPESKTIEEVDVPMLTNYVKQIAPNEFEKQMINELKANTIEWYTDSNTKNTASNNYRGIKMFYARLFLLGCVFTGLVLLIDVLYIKHNIMSKKETKPKEVPKRPEASPITHQRSSKSTDGKTKLMIEKK